MNKSNECPLNESYCWAIDCNCKLEEPKEEISEFEVNLCRDKNIDLESRNIALQHDLSKVEAENEKLKKTLNDVKQFIHDEIIERRDYSASKAYEEVLNKIEEQ